MTGDERQRDRAGERPVLPAIPIVDVGVDWPFETLDREFDRLNALLDEAGRIPELAVRMADAVSRRWLKRWHEPYLAEIDRIAARVGRPGAYFLNVSYEWGCTSSAVSSPDGSSARLMRVLDWPDRGLGRYVIAAQVSGNAGRWLTLTWPGYTGVLQAMAPGRFSAAVNQAPMEQAVGSLPLDWLLNRAQVWRQPHLTPAHLLRQVFERARSFGEAKAMLTETPIALPAIYILAGLAATETCVIERKPEDARVIDGSACAANDWQSNAWSGRPRGTDNAARRHRIRAAVPSMNPAFGWLQPPILNSRTRLALVADATLGTIIAQGYEPEGAATAVLRTTVGTTAAGDRT